MTTVRTRTERRHNAELIERKENAGRRIPWFAAAVAWGTGTFIAVGRLWDYGAIGVWSTALILLTSWAYAMWVLGWVGITVNVLTYVDTIPMDEVIGAIGMETVTNPAPARMFVQTGPATIEPRDLGFADAGEVQRLGVILQSTGWAWKRDPNFGIAKIRGNPPGAYTTAYTNINGILRARGMIGEDGTIKEQYRPWFISPTPDLVTDIQPVRPDDDPS